MNQVVLWVVWLAVIVAVVVAECPFGYTQRRGGNCYKVRAEKRHWWNTAKTECEKEGAFLASIRNRWEADWVNALYFKKRNPGDHCSDWYWIGVNDQAKEGEWRYAGSNKLARYSNWYQGEPNNHWKLIWKGYAVARNENTVTVNVHTKKWNDETADWLTLCYVCEMYPLLI